MHYQILEDCSPYYIRFTHPGIDSVIEKCLKYVQGVEFVKGFTNHRYQLAEGFDILSSVPMTDVISFMDYRVSLFVTNPGYYYRAHKDGLDHRYSLNYTVKILDDKCVTSWYSDDDLKQYAIDNLPKRNSRECIGFDKSKHTPLKSMVATQGECVLFNTEIFHDFDNSNSQCQRMVLTLRDNDPSNVYFENIKERLFGVK